MRPDPLAWWQSHFGEIAPRGHLLRRALSERWVRFHSLPDSKRYAESADEYAELQRRHLAVASVLFGAGEASPLAADDGSAFTEAELLTKARILQAPFVGDIRLTEGVGIYRAGIKKRLPSYYIWGARSRADAPSAALTHTAKFA
jgi:hypothetical protein